MSLLDIPWWIYAIALAVASIAVMFRAAENAPLCDEDGRVLSEEEIKEINKYFYTKVMETGQYTEAVIKLPKDITLRVPIKAIIKIDGYVLMMDPNAGDYTIFRGKVKETAPCVPVVNINRSIIHFE